MVFPEPRGSGRQTCSASAGLSLRTEQTLWSRVAVRAISANSVWRKVLHWERFTGIMGNDLCGRRALPYSTYQVLPSFSDYCRLQRARIRHRSQDSCLRLGGLPTLWAPPVSHFFVRFSGDSGPVKIIMRLELNLIDISSARFPWCPQYRKLGGILDGIRRAAFVSFALIWSDLNLISFYFHSALIWFDMIRFNLV